ncbi:SusC/RagA family TonB-linked outer membrane protein [Sphingobacterium griseoflavum]|uniref:SusC/RagA family TonB-linked outer membrane protein n=1 Tax=Sphingobacterium griseoflavum TaxID=1474952 RepID=A0ABQ3HSF5_9SPHI|nr:SusC/RagA family TonB-linked outer membrane protein [Sphingobacterium griseoflavum]GHE23386.1 SusC/RagA family TonB-linked outer membrane protein [Sphingobacterium griseoflavum]
MKIKFIRSFLVGAALLLLHVAVAQQVLIKGRITDKDKTGLGNVTISVESPKRDVGKTEDDGRFEVSVPAKSVLLFRLQGYLPLKQPLSAGKTTYNLMMESTTQELEETVVVGYQQRARSTLTGSVVSISGKEIQDIPSGNWVELLQGRVAGLNIQNNTGSPGMRGTIALRGISNINVSGSGDNAFLTPTSPLFVIDGVPVDENTGFEYGFETAGPGLSPISMIPPEDIESIDILKDAQATALYGSRGAFGVILVTTKRGNSEVPIVRYTAQTFFNAVPALRQTLGGRQERWMRVDQILRYDTTLARAFQRINDSPILADSLNPYWNNSTDWQSYFYRNTINQSHNLDISGGRQTFNYKVNMGYFDERGIIENTGLKRYTLQTNMQYRPTEQFMLMANVNSSLARNSVGSGNATMQSGVGRSVNTSSLYPAPSIFTGSMEALSALSVNDDNKTGNFVSQVEMQYEPFRGIRATSTLNFTYFASTKDRFTPELLNGNRSLLYNYYDRRNRLYNRNSLAYTKSWMHGTHLLNLFGFSEMEMTDYRAETSNLVGTVNDRFQAGLSYDTRFSGGGTLDNMTNYRSVSYAGSAMYSFKSRYIVEGTYRVDGTSTTGGASPWSYNPSVGLRWNIKEEGFAKDINWLDNALIRGTYGRNITPTGSLSDLYGWYKIDPQTYNNRPTTSLDLINAPNVNLRPQSSTQWSGAVEFGVLHNRLSFTYEAYYRQSDQILRSKPIADHNAFANVLTNETSLVNYGHEFMLNFRPKMANPDWNFTFGANAAINRDRTAALPDGVRQLLQPDGSAFDLPQLYRLGRNPLGFVLYNYEGVYLRDEDVPVNPLTGLRYRAGGTLAEGRFFRAGDPKFTDINGDYILDENDLVFVGNSQPRITGGFNTFTQYKNWSLTTSFSFTLDRDILNTALTDRFRNYADPAGVGFAGSYVPLDVYNVWRNQGDNADFPNVSDFTRLPLYNPYRYNSTLFLEDGSYLKFNSATLGYNFDRNWTRRFGISSARLYISGFNLYNFNRYSGPDPELVTALGRDASSGFPNRRSYTFGMNIQF